MVKQYLKNKYNQPAVPTASAFAPANIALIKYWGKRNQTLNLPVTDSFSISLADHGTKTTISESHSNDDVILLNGEQVDKHTAFYERLIDFLNLFRHDPNYHFYIDTESNIPIAAGLASSASGFAACVKALNHYYQWELNKTELSILARLGSGSACRSLWHGFVHWHAGIKPDGSDSHGEYIHDSWPELRIGLLIIDGQQKALSSRQAMLQTTLTSPFYKIWPNIVADDINHLYDALKNKNFQKFAQTIEQNALAMHATMLTAQAPIMYYQAETIALIHDIWRLRRDNVPVYFTQDAGPNIKALFLAQHLDTIQTQFPTMKIVSPFAH